jgi:hypothetical protein
VNANAIDVVIHVGDISYADGFQVCLSSFIVVLFLLANALGRLSVPRVCCASSWCFCFASLAMTSQLCPFSVVLSPRRFCSPALLALLSFQPRRRSVVSCKFAAPLGHVHAQNRADRRASAVHGACVALIESMDFVFAGHTDANYLSSFCVPLLPFGRSAELHLIAGARFLPFHTLLRAAARSFSVQTVPGNHEFWFNFTVSLFAFINCLACALASSV